MSLSVLARSSFLRQQSRGAVRSLHSTSPVGSAHGDYHHLPFALPGQKKAAFATKLGLYLATGFALPFVAAGYQLSKAGGSDA